MIEELKDKKQSLLSQKAKANYLNDVIEELKIDLQIHKIDVQICTLLLPKSESNRFFKPNKAENIKAVLMEKVGLDYIPLIKGAYNVLAGRGGSGKSGIALTSMIKWLKLNPKKQGLAFFTEDGINEIKDRAKIICNKLGMSMQILERIHFITLDNDDRIKWVGQNRDGYTINFDYIDEVIDFCLNNSIEYIILDPLKRFHSLNENSNDDMDVLVRDAITHIAVKTNAVTLVLHHSSKAQNGARGASTISDSARAAWQIGRYFVKDKEDKMVLDESRKDKIKLDIIKDNMGIEKLCKIRGEHNSIDNPLSRFIYSNGPIITEYQCDMPIEL
jgi:RecA-family ATPase